MQREPGTLHRGNSSSDISLPDSRGGSPRIPAAARVRSLNLGAKRHDARSNSTSNSVIIALCAQTAMAGMQHKEKSKI